MIPLQTQNSNIALFQTQNSNTYQHHGTKFSTSSSCFIIYQRPLFILHPLLFSSSQRLYSVQQDQTKETNKNYMIILTRLLGILKKTVFIVLISYCLFQYLKVWVIRRILNMKYWNDFTIVRYLLQSCGLENFCVVNSNSKLLNLYKLIDIPYAEMRKERREKWKNKIILFWCYWFNC